MARTELPRIGAVQIAAFLAAFVGAAGFWWLYFDRSAEDGTRVVAQSADPGDSADRRTTSSTRS